MKRAHLRHRLITSINRIDCPVRFSQNMRWRKLFRPRGDSLPLWAGLCLGCADGSNPQYSAGEKHAILAMVRASESEAEDAICSLLHSNGWSNPELRQLKLIREPFHSDDPVMLTCYENATRKAGGIVVYSDVVGEE